MRPSASLPPSCPALLLPGSVLPARPALLPALLSAYAKAWRGRYIDIIKPPLEGAEVTLSPTPFCPNSPAHTPLGSPHAWAGCSPQEQLGPIQAGLHGASGAFSPEIYYHFDRGEMHNGLVSVAYNLRPVGPMDGGT